MTEREPQYPTSTIMFRDRELLVRMPRPEQLIVWRRTMRSLQAANPETWDAAEVLDTMERGRKIVDSLLDKNGRTWLDDLMLEGDLGLVEICSIITMATEAFKRDADSKSGEAKPAKKTAKKPVKKATRKAAS